MTALRIVKQVWCQARLVARGRISETKTIRGNIISGEDKFSDRTLGVMMVK